MAGTTQEATTEVAVPVRLGLRGADGTPVGKTSAEASETSPAPEAERAFTVTAYSVPFTTPFIVQEV